MDGSTKLKDVLKESISISDRTCVDCSGPVTVFMVVDKVWDGLGFAVKDWACLECVARRLNPEHPPDTLGKLNDLIVRRRRRFKLEKFNGYFRETRVPLNRSIMVVTPLHDSMKTVSGAQLGRGTEPRKSGVYDGEDALSKTRSQVAEYHIPLERVHGMPWGAVPYEPPRRRLLLTGEPETLTKTEINLVAAGIAAQLHQDHEYAEGLVFGDHKLAGSVLVTAYPVETGDQPACHLFEAGDEEDVLRREVVELLERGGVPIGFVKYESKRKGEGGEIEITSRLFIAASGDVPGAGQLLQKAEKEVGSHVQAQMKAAAAALARAE